MSVVGKGHKSFFGLTKIYTAAIVHRGVRMSQRELNSPARLSPRLVSRDEAAEYTGVSLTTFKEHVQPRLRVVEIGRRVLFDVQELDKWVEEQKVSVSGGPAIPRPPTSVSRTPGIVSSSRRANEILDELRKKPHKSTLT